MGYQFAGKSTHNFTENNFFRKSEHTNNTMPILPDANEDFDDKLTFWVNGKRHVVQNPDPAMTLNEWLRSQRGLTGTKVMCREGGCGCCVVMVTHSDLTNGGACSYSLNSCLCPLCSVDGWSITTVEGLGGQKGGFHPIQRRLADFSGSQCGYCSPGMVVNMYGLLNKKPLPNKQEVENHFNGHICRCTGYRPILDAMKSFAVDADPEKGGCIDIEDLNKHPCPSAGEACNGASANGNGVNGTSTGSLRCCQHGVTWYRPTSLAELYSLLEQHSQDKYKLVCGNTAAGVYKDDGPYSCLIDIKAVPDLYNCQAGPPLVVGSAVSLSAVVDLLRASSDRSPSYSVLADHLCKVANVSVRNVGSWAGNLMVKHAHPEFPSDVFTIMEAAGAKVTIGNKDESQRMALSDFLGTAMNGKVIRSLEIPPGNSEDVFRTYKVAPRSQNAHAYVNAGFRMTLDRQSDLKVVTKPYIVFGGVNKTMVHASATEDFLVGKRITDPETLRGALAVLQAELVPDESALQSAQYTKQLAMGLFYKFYLSAVGKESLTEQVRTAADSLARPLSRGEQHFQTKESEWPLRQPMPKTSSRVQSSGEAIYINDMPAMPGEVYAAFVTSTVANCKLGNLDFSHAMEIPGAVAYLTAGDVRGENNYNLPSFPVAEIFSSDEVSYAGQPLALVIADTQVHADAMAKAVQVTYTDMKPPILTIQDAISAEFFHPNVQEVIKGDPKGALAAAPHRISGEVSCGSQYHFYMETQVCRCTPTEDGMDVQSATQSMDSVQASVAQVTGMSAHRVYVSVKRVGGAFGGKGPASMLPAAACAVAAQNLNRTVRLSMSIDANMEAMSKRSPYLVKYEVGFDDEGRLLAMVYNLYEDNGYSVHLSFMYLLPMSVENVYYCPNWQLTGQTCKTHTAPTTYTRAPGFIAAHFCMEHIIEHVAKTLNKDPTDIRRINMFEKGQTILSGDVLSDCNITQLWDDLLTSAQIKQRQQEIEVFNKENRWKKRGLSVVPCRYPFFPSLVRFTVFVAIYHTDGSVVITHGGIEMGQGVDTKVMQVAAATLGVPMEMVHTMSTNSLSSPNSGDSGGNVTSELNCQGVLECCRRLNERINPIRQEMGGAPKWTELINTCHSKGVDLSEKYMEHHPLPTLRPTYNNYGVTCTELELDVLTGEREITRSDILFDCGKSVNPELDIGQVEGGFVFGLGYWLTEKCVYDKETGRLLTNGTWEYKPPATKDIPADLRVTLLPNSFNPYNVIRSKGVSEPVLLMSCSAMFALRQAIQSAREDSGNGADFFPLNGPATVETCHEACLVDSSNFTL
ncbi:xanthine dehydrogenase-like isoform X4 [Branchiostoma floridae]|uniref:Xanthine dehydrogenase-like isoform X4 n=1 Tax=Branchiostoma floridae TaxID=7739 RepID=A0A9J7LXN7_BRAFL|nr:xanthine dehydrogenase-like isoform X4 [Branchiostoma floridae]